VRDLGEHRLKEPDRIGAAYQLGHDDFPPVRTLDGGSHDRKRNMAWGSRVVSAAAKPARRAARANAGRTARLCLQAGQNPQ
jgi:hypothetical protein